MVLKKLFFIYLALILVSHSAVGQKKTADDILFTVEDQSVTVEEFKYVYNKNNINNDSAFTKKDIENYFDLFINFKLKIKEAKNRKMDQSDAFKEELNGYIEQLKKPYLTENAVTNRLIEEAYNRFKQEIRAQHILIKLDEEDTLKAYNKALEVREMIVNGQPFNEVAQKYSDDPSVKINNGDLGYFTSFQMVYPFESAAYNTAEGEISMPVRTQFGYHLVKVLDKRPANGKVQVAHIMLRHKADTTTVRDKIFEIYEQATGGVDWNELVKQYSEDVNSKNTKGILRAFSVGQMPIEFQEASFQLKDEGQISDPIKTKYGWHIIKLVKREGIDSFDNMKDMISARISKDVRSELNEKVLIQRLKKENGFSVNEKAYKLLKEKADSSVLKGNWKPELGKKSPDNLLTIGNSEISANQFVEFVNEEDKSKSSSPGYTIDLLFEKFQNIQIKKYEEDHLADKYIDYKMLVKEYHEGILLFQLMEEEVWNKAIEDSVGLANFYEKHKEDYMWGKRAEVKLYSASDKSIISRIQKAIEEKDSTYLRKENLYKTYNSGSSVTLQTESGLFEKGVIEALDRVNWEVGVYTTEYAGKHHLVVISGVEEPRIKKLNEAKGAVISDYQNELEKEWLKTLKEKYSVNVNQKALNKVYEQLVQ
ncbi:foldase protein PrsA [Fulvivirga lutea]|uniref:Peptidylprolyl isomerase n=1 Tax=Fulvivirga lutea TaxID=2810512 RepID=A0A974WHS8_9BACT|nr:peptidylprolyl isomerase [Fulvivirga lutea]QSE98385.1 peptidylprolyl isomerase [Fulvivirga lutea]